MREAAAKLDAGLAELVDALGSAFDGARRCEELQVDYTALFLNPTGPLAMPYESSWVAGKDPMQVAGGPRSPCQALSTPRRGSRSMRSFQDLPDHIAAELEFLFALIFREARARAIGRPGGRTGGDRIAAALSSLAPRALGDAVHGRAARGGGHRVLSDARRCDAAVRVGRRRIDRLAAGRRMTSTPSSRDGAFGCVMRAWLAHEAELLGFLRHQVGDPHRAEDLLQEVFLKAMRQGQGFCDSRSRAPGCSRWRATPGRRCAAAASDGAAGRRLAGARRRRAVAGRCAGRLRRAQPPAARTRRPGRAAPLRSRGWRVSRTTPIANGLTLAPTKARLRRARMRLRRC